MSSRNTDVNLIVRRGETLGVVELGSQRVVGRQVVTDVGVLAGERLGGVGVVPEVGPAHLGLQLGQPAARLADAQVHLGLAEPSAQLAQVI